MEWTKGLDEPASGAGGTASLLHLFAVFLGQDEDRRALVLSALAQPLCQADAVQAGHVLVSKHQAEVVLQGFFPCVLPVDGPDDIEARVFKGA